MLFTDSLFLFYFLPIILLLHFLTTSFRRGPHYNNLSRLALFSATLAFYGIKEPWWLIPFFLSITFDFIWASLLVRAVHPGVRRGLCFLSIVQNTGLLALFKYWNFIGANLGAIAPGIFAAFPHFTHNRAPLMMPAGISFYTFESLSFVIDVYRREIAPPRNPLEFFAFIAMFPRLVAGPIVRYRQMRGQFARYHGMEIEAGLATFVGGLFLKVCFADSFAVFVKYAFREGVPAGCAAAWIGTLAYTMQIYFDFSGYSLMAIGLGRCLGFHFPDNFRRPYLSTSLKDFWRRWHISLSSWLRDYLYLPLGGNRAGRWRTYLNLFLTMLIGGLWHGAAWTFLAWGAWHGICLCIERALGGGESSGLLAWLRTILAVVIGWTFFRARDFHEAIRVLQSMASPWHSHFNPEGITTHLFSLSWCLLGLFYAFYLEPRLDSLRARSRALTGWETTGVAAMFAASLLVLFSSESIPFLYFQF